MCVKYNSRFWSHEQDKWNYFCYELLFCYLTTSFFLIVQSIYFNKKFVFQRHRYFTITPTHKTHMKAKQKKRKKSQKKGRKVKLVHMLWPLLLICLLRTRRFSLALLDKTVFILEHKYSDFFFKILYLFSFFLGILRFSSLLTSLSCFLLVIWFCNFFFIQNRLWISGKWTFSPSS